MDHNIYDHCYKYAAAPVVRMDMAVWGRGIGFDMFYLIRERMYARKRRGCELGH